MNRSTKPIIFDYKKAKATQAILWLLHKHGGSMDKLKLVKLIFYADREHLARYGRPIVGGSYVAMQHGPVSSDLLNRLNEATPQSGSLFTIDDYRILANSFVDEDKLSESDIEVLTNVNNEYGRYDSFTLCDITHKLKAWDKNYPDKNSNTSNPLPYEDFFLDLKDDSILDIIRDNQESWAELGW
jgi:uncharacterized phage-associated protein